MGERVSKSLVEALAKGQSTFERPQGNGFVPLPEIPPMHQGQLFNLGGKTWSNGSAQSVDLSLQPYIDRQNGKVGLDGAHLIFRKTW